MTEPNLTEDDLYRLIHAVENPPANSKFFYGDIRESVLLCLKELLELRGEVEDLSSQVLEGDTDSQIIQKLFRKNPIGRAPNRRTYCAPHSEVVLSIDKDTVALLTLPTEALPLLDIDPDTRK